MDERGPNLQTVRIIWGALLAAQFFYFYLLAGGIVQVNDQPPEPMLLPVLSVVAMAMGGASVFLPRVILRGMLAQNGAQLREMSGLPPDRFLSRCIQLGLQPYIISLALSEAIAIFGLLLGVLGFRLLTVAPFFATATMLFLVQFPTEGRFRMPVEEALGAQR